MASAVAVAEAVEDLSGLSPTLKWPNDVLLNGRKLSGILIERVSDTAANSGPAITRGPHLRHRSEEVGQPSTILIGIGLKYEWQQLIFGLLILPMVALYSRSPHIRAQV